MPNPSEYEEIRDIRADIAALSVMVASNAAETRRAFAGIEQLLVDARKELAALKKILTAVTPPVAASVIAGWNGDLHTYTLTNTGETIVMSDISIPDTNSAAFTLTVVDEDQNAFTPATPPSYTEDSTTFGTVAPAADGMTATFVPTVGQGVGKTTVTIQVTNDDPTAPTPDPLVTSVTTTLSAEGAVTAAWADSGLTVVAAPPATDTPPASA